MAPWELLDERSESDLHKARLLNVEEKPFKRITKRLGSISKIVSIAAGYQEARNGTELSALLGIHSLREDLTFDFAAFDSSIARFQFLHDANRHERGRYDADQRRILAECQAVRANNAQLREQLDAARATLAQRKKFDELAEKITSNRLLKPREDQFANLAKLEVECRELERESETYRETWNERRDQFNRIMEEGMMLRRQIRDEKEEVDRREGMDEGGEDDAEPEKDDKGDYTPRIAPIDNPSPLPDDEGQPKTTENEVETPRPMSSGGTPVPDKTKSWLSLPKDGRRRREPLDAQLPTQVADDASRSDVDMGDAEQPAKLTGEGDDGHATHKSEQRSTTSMEIDD
ncbi:Tho complex subunit 7/Mft1p [Drechmeria coniospora]|uniref:Tho complex subunit 7/Mft1p n=1 Tax=Drechmeria coniospora TaxID=98403 RepID=A0A151GKT0_DRECN|nr:Tho complex subunit 7/Mft1p [Drechmeria coniospora]KYK57696.1 Tho complex subunit 7/Mft1p [Drechmeria coniospora]ODA79586.1 hypothetical protein RJ55_05180 [Drechmeria coniospora]